jgi:hypothetical protein
MSMQNPPESGAEMPEGVETPESIRFAHWVWNHIVGEGQVIRRAPVAVFVLAAIIAYGLHWLDSKSHSDEIAALNNILEQRNATIVKDNTSRARQDSSNAPVILY